MQAAPLNQEEALNRNVKCTAKKTNDPLLIQDKLKYSHQQDTDLVQAHSITVNPVRPLVETTGTAYLHFVILSSQVKYIYLALFTIQIVSKLLHSINQDQSSVCLFMKKDNQDW